jgi:hypothetical protein
VRTVFEHCCTYAADIYTIAAGTYTLSVTAVPEPAAWMLMIFGIGATGVVMLRRAGINGPSYRDVA